MSFHPDPSSTDGLVEWSHSEDGRPLPYREAVILFSKESNCFLN